MSHSEHVRAKHRLKEINDVAAFRSLLDRCTLCDEDKTILSLIYLRGKPLDFVADELGISYSTAKRYHARAIRKIKQFLY